MPNLADAEACEDINNLPQCAANCLPGLFDCNGAQQALCAAEYEGITSCYERDCQLREYLYSMNITNAVCEIPPRSRHGTQIAVGSSFITLTTIIMGFRLAGRPPFSDSFGVDDVIGIVTFITAMVDTAMMIAGANIGWGTDMWALTQAQIITQMKFFYVGILFFYFSVSVSKLAILFFYLRIFTTRTFKRVTYGLIALCSAYSVAVVFQSAFDCTPASYYWTRFDGISEGTCLSYTAFKVMPPLNIALDVVVMLLPLPLLLKLNLPLAKKIRVISMFSVGILIIVAGILRLSHLYHSITTYNITYNGGEISYYGVIEGDVSVMCTCMPAIAALLKRLLPRCLAQ
ncbi:hypothetical protein ASPVEDRAFT_89425 [Aspergillus versicolor CBS 583.65]|uniref:Rhodopsin domain-containing protein n=1 Tax=Aspergillus versicolor CBS 583.65 TaxID=1036611 RepID=A0A1L9Q388_ASPVE|nr:uncharacterized protein ASPVEDRAFT_89425 [Aspergillus versicolor CBS 583.65]OJJ08196.1 hypothetical protein ASPVEDRAFT_89425 [Aspergillus versicolor CBS 583.65]